MKKITASFTILVYLAFTCGVMVTYHYCMDRYDSFRLYKPSSDWCPTCGMHIKGKGCCHDQVTIVKIFDAHQTSSVVSSIEKLQHVTASATGFLFSAPVNENIGIHKIDHSPPLFLSRQGVYIENRVFRI